MSWWLTRQREAGAAVEEQHVTDSPADGIRQLSELPIWVAPMAGGPSTPALVIGAARAGALGFLAGGYKTAESMLAEIRAVRAAGVSRFGVNVFVPGAPARDPEAVTAYVASLREDASQVRAALGEPLWDDDHWADKIAVLIADKPTVVSFTFGCPPADVVRSLQHGGTLVAVTVTGPGEAASAVSAGTDLLCVQGPEGGAHRGTFINPPGDAGNRTAGSQPGAADNPQASTGNPPGTAGDPRQAADNPRTAADNQPRAVGEKGPGLLALIAEVAEVTDLPLVAAGGIADARAVAAALSAGAAGVQAGTAFLRCPESGAHALHKAALADPRFTATEVTRAFSGRPARALVNQFVRDHAGAPAAYPEINNATRPLRAAAAARGDPDRMSLYAGTGFRAAADQPAAEIIKQLAAGTPR
jgi:nitronate monooxygenase